MDNRLNSGKGAAESCASSSISGAVLDVCPAQRPPDAEQWKIGIVRGTRNANPPGGHFIDGERHTERKKSMRIKSKIARLTVAVTLAAPVAVIGGASSPPVAQAATSCPTNHACLGRASYTVETTGTAMYGFSTSGTGYQNLNNFTYGDTTIVNNRSWRIRNRLANNRKICVYNGFNLLNISHVEIYSSTIAWNDALPDDNASSWYLQASNANC